MGSIPALIRVFLCPCVGPFLLQTVYMGVYLYSKSKGSVEQKSGVGSLVQFRNFFNFLCSSNKEKEEKSSFFTLSLCFLKLLDTLQKEMGSYQISFSLVLAKSKFLIQRLP